MKFYVSLKGDKYWGNFNADSIPAAKRLASLRLEPIAKPGDTIRLVDKRDLHFFALQDAPTYTKVVTTPDKRRNRWTEPNYKGDTK